MSEEVDEGLVERVAAAIQAVVASEFSRNRAATHHDGARAAIAAMREAGFVHEGQVDRDAASLQRQISVLCDERDREKARADYAEQTIQERNNTIACQDRRYEDLERELRELREQQTPITVPLELTGNVAAEWAKMQERLAALEQASQERCQDINEHELRLVALEQRRKTVEDLEQRTPEWRSTSGDTAYAEPFTTIRACIDCQCLIAGGPTRCKACVRELEQPQPPSAPYDQTCEQCGSSSAGIDGTWRWAGDCWQHRCEGADGQVGHWTMPRPPIQPPSAPAAQTKGCDRSHAHSEPWEVRTSSLKDAPTGLLRSADALLQDSDLAEQVTDWALDNAALIAHHAGLHVWSGDADGLHRDLVRWRIDSRLERLDTILRRHGLVQAAAGAAGEGE